MQSARFIHPTPAIESFARVDHHQARRDVRVLCQSRVKGAFELTGGKL